MHINEERIAFYFELGLAISQWASVEFALLSIVAGTLKYEDLVHVTNAYRSIENFRSKLTYVDTMLRSVPIPEAEKPNWATLYDQTAQASKKRNRLAHYWVLQDTTHDTPGRRMMLLPTKQSFAPPKRGQKFIGAIHLRDIVSYRLEFSALMCRLENFDCRLRGQPEQLPKSLEQPKRPPTLAALRRQIYAFAAHPPRPLRK